MLNKIAELIGKLSLDYWTYICLGVIGAVFIVGLIVSLTTGDANKFKSVAKRAIKNPVPANLHATAKLMPVKVKKQYKQARVSGVKPGDVITLDACVNAPYAGSAAARFGSAVMAASLFMTALIFVVGPLSKAADAATVIGTYAATALVIAAGMILRLIAGIVSMGVQKSCTKTYIKYIEILDKAFKGGAAEPEMPADEPAEEIPLQSEAFAQSPFMTDDEPVMQTVEPQAEPEEAESTVYTPNNMFDDEPTRITVELADDEPEETEEPEAAPVIMEPVESEADSKAKAREAAIAAAREEQARIQAEAAAREQAEIAAREQAEAAAKARAEAAAKAREAARERAAQAAQQATATQTAPTASPVGGSADDVIARIEKINREGAPLATMKEVALLLQQERAKPENKTPEQQRKLNEALASLLKAMSTANRR